MLFYSGVHSLVLKILIENVFDFKISFDPEGGFFQSEGVHLCIVFKRIMIFEAIKIFILFVFSF